MQQVQPSGRPTIHHLGSPAIRLSQQFDRAIARAGGVSENSDNVYEALAAVLRAESGRQPRLLVVCADLIDDSEMEFFDLLEQECPGLEVCVYSHVSGGQRLEYIATHASARTVSPDQIANTLVACIDRSAPPPAARAPEQAAPPMPIAQQPMATPIAAEPPAAEMPTPAADHAEPTADESTAAEAPSLPPQRSALAPAVQIAPTPQDELATQDEPTMPEQRSLGETLVEPQDDAPASLPPTPSRVAPRRPPQPDTTENTFGALVTPEELAALLDQNDQAGEKGEAQP